MNTCWQHYYSTLTVKMTPTAAAAIDNLRDYANAVVQVQFPSHFTLCRLAATLYRPIRSIMLTVDLPPGSVPDYRPVNIGGAESRESERLDNTLAFRVMH